MKTVLIPTDFSEKSLELIKSAILAFPDSQLKLVLVSGYKLDPTHFDSIFFRSRNVIRKLVTKTFRNKLNELCKLHSDRIFLARLELFTGTNSAAFNNFLNDQAIDEAIVPENRLKNAKKRKYFDITPFVIKNMFPDRITNVQYDNEHILHNENRWFSISF